jgi:ribosomal protein S18 acetylase RimI-like enzyme
MSVMDLSTIEFFSGSEALIDEMASFWEGQKRHHWRLSKDFQLHYQEKTFQRRKTVLLDKAKEGEMRVDIAIDESSQRKVGYCIASVSRSQVGEIDSIYVDPDYRGRGIGDVLMNKALTWMYEMRVSSIIVGVSAGNEGVFQFYTRYGFLHRTTVLEQVR